MKESDEKEELYLGKPMRVFDEYDNGPVTPPERYAPDLKARIAKIQARKAAAKQVSNTP